MAKQTITTLVDDLDGTPIEEGKGETVKFALDNTAFEIDLNESNAKEFRKLFSRYVDVARVTGKATRGTRASSGRNSKEDLAAAREWLRENGHEVSDRGRIPANLMELYRSSK